MANQSKLKAWVRYDGTNTVVTAGPIFRAAKPKVGNWRQINADLCCNPSGSTTTTTTQGGGGNTPTAWTVQVFPNSGDACTGNTGYGPYVVYTAGSNLTTGVTLWSNAELTIPYSPYPGRPWLADNTGSVTTNAFYAEFNGSNTTVTSEVNCLTTTTTTTTAFVGTYYVAGPNAEVCGGTGPYSLPLIVDPNACSNGGITLAVGTYADYGITNGSVIYINLQNGNVIQVQTFGSSTMSFGCQSCG